MAMHGYNEEDDVIGKAYDSRLVGRLMGYIRPYGWRVVMSLVLPTNCCGPPSSE